MNELKGLSTAVLGRNLVQLSEVDSTNNYAKENAKKLPHGTVVLSDYQTGGKGRMGKAWSNPKGTTLAMSLLLRRGVSMKDMPLLPLLAGLGVCQGLEDLCGIPFSIKWSNDVLCQEKKVCGILCESRVLPGQEPFAVVGIGVNLLQSDEDFSSLGLVYANSLFLATDKQFLPQDTAVCILNRLESVWERYQQEGFPAVKEMYKKRCITLHRRVRVLWKGAELEAQAVDIADDGSLVCVKDSGDTVHINAGESSVRGLYGYV